MPTIDLNEARMIDLTTLCEILGIGKRTYLKNPAMYPPATRTAEQGKNYFLNLDVQAWLLTGGRLKTHLEFAREQAAYEQAERAGA